LKVTLYTLFALVAFAANSLLCRLALVNGHIDAWNFTGLRLVSGAMCLGFILFISTYSKAISNNDVRDEQGSWRSSLSLVVYALCFSIAYVDLDTGTGALILFSAVQLTMISWGIFSKERLSNVQWLAFLIALGGFIYLMMPSTKAPSLIPGLLMMLSGIAWGIYSIRGKACKAPLKATALNFIRSLFIVPLMLIIGFSALSGISWEGILLAVLSGSLASGLGYSLWYVAIPLLKSSQAAVVQLLVPVIATIAGVIFLNENITVHFIIASAVILGAVLVFLKAKSAPVQH
jgi:drug/metabolite transporter (DMT)-like permease